MRHAVCVVVLVASAIWPLTAQRPREPAREPEAQRWHHLTIWLVAVNRHQPGMVDGPVIEIASWSEDRVNAVVADIRELARFLVRAHARFQRSGQPSTYTFAGRSLTMAEVQQLLALTDDEARRGDLGRLVLAAVLLHTDIAAALDRLDPVTRPSESARPTAVLVVDGRFEGTSDRGPHWGLARSMFDLIPADSPHADARTRWYVATAAFMHGRTHMADLVPHMDKALRILPDEGNLLFFDGAMHETLAAPFLQAAMRDLPAEPGTKLDVVGGRTHLQEARKSFGRALERNADHVESRVRLGRVLGLLGQHEQAARELERASTEATSPVLRYYAVLFLGAEYGHLRKPAAAREAYERAATLYPRAQSPRLGLSSLARAEGNRAGAISALIEVLRFPQRDDSRDPWWAYFTGAREAGDRMLDAWRQSVAPWGHR